MWHAEIFKGSLLLLVAVVIVADGRRRHRYRNMTEIRSMEFDMLIFTQTWPQTACFAWKKQSVMHECSLPGHEEWSIHGIWPTKNHEVGPYNCNSSMPFDIKMLESIEDELKIKWIDIHKGRAGHPFWTHEWMKHGTCAAVLEPFNSEFKYFKKGIELLVRYDMKDVLNRESISAGGSYKVEQIADAVRAQLGKTAVIQCVFHRKTKEAYLSEIRICFDKNITLIDCENAVGFPHNCGHNRDVIYPGTVPNVILI